MYEKEKNESLIYLRLPVSVNANVKCAMPDAKEMLHSAFRILHFHILEVRL